MKVFLGFDTSCYTTSAAGVNEAGEVVGFSRMLLPVKAGQRGLRQSEAVFAHMRQLPLVMEALMKQLPVESTIAGVCASVKPRADKDSYMPVFTVGRGAGKLLAEGLRVPFWETSHQQGHIAAGKIGLEPMETPFVALHISGGTTDLLLCGQEDIQTIGGCLDIHAGQLVDRIGVKLGLPFPAGPGLEQLALANQEPTTALLPLSLEHNDLNCHFSGGEACAMRLIEKKAYSQERIAAEIYDLLARTVARMLKAGCTAVNARKALVVGGVASSELLRGLIVGRLQKLRAPLTLFFGEKQYSADNASGVARIGWERFLREKQGKNA